MGKRARIPSQKALVAQASSSLVTTNQGRKGNQNKFDVVVNQSPRGKENTQLEEQLTEEETESHVKMQEEWVKMVQSPTSSRKLSWAEVVEAAEETVAKRPIWDNFDIGKISNAGFKLGYIAPETHGKSSVCAIDVEDMSSELDYWKSIVVCYVLGAQPPSAVLSGYI